VRAKKIIFEPAVEYLLSILASHTAAFVLYAPACSPCPDIQSDSTGLHFIALLPVLQASCGGFN
jgi:hypothetical protein